MHATLLNQGMVIVGLRYALEEQMRMDEITGCPPYGTSIIVGA
jgi:NAD(P)H dehydrogenase (quinone)